MNEILLARAIRRIYSGDAELDYVMSESMGQSWTTPGEYPFVVPPNVYFLCGVAIGGGGGSYSKTTVAGNWGSAGGGGGLGWKNRIPVTPGEVLTVVVGAPGANANMGTNKVYDGGISCVKRGTTIIFAGYGGKGGGQSGSNQTTAGKGGSFLGDGGGNGGDAPSYNYWTSGGGAAGGYAGKGGTGGTNASGLQGATNGQGGAGSGGTGDVTKGKGGRGGCTGLLGQGSSGILPTTPNTNGNHGSYYRGSGGFGAGGSISNEGFDSAIPARQGAVRLIWEYGQGAATRAFPSTNVGPL